MRSLVALLALGLVSGCAQVSVRPAVSYEQRPYVARVVSYDMSCAVLDALDPRDTRHLDCLTVRILSPEDMKDREWRLFIYNEVWTDPVDYGYRRGDTVVIDVPRFHATRAEISSAIESKEGLGGFRISHELVKKIHQPPAPTPPPSPGREHP